MMTQTRRTGLSAALITACLAVAAPAAADAPGPNALPVNVVAVQTPDAYDQAEALTKALRTAIKEVPGWSLGEGDYSLEVLTLSLKCNDVPNASCQSRIADQIKADRYIWGNIAKKGPNITGELHLWVRGQGTTSTPLSYSANLTEPNDEALRKVASDAVLALTGGPPKGSIHVRAGNIDGQVFIDGQPVGALANGEATFPSSSGTHVVLVKASGYSDAESSVVVKPNVTADVGVTLVPVEVETPTNWRRVGGFVGVGAGAAFGIVGVISSLQVSSLQSDLDGTHYANTINKGDSVCDTAADRATPEEVSVDDICGKASTFQLMQAIFYPLAAVSAGLGVYLIVTSNDSAAPTSGFTVTPAVGKDTGKLNVTYRW